MWFIFIYNSEGEKKHFSRFFVLLLHRRLLKSVLLVVVKVMGHVGAAPFVWHQKKNHLWNAGVATSPACQGQRDEAFGGSISGMASR